jgi:hypothetical protein
MGGFCCTPVQNRAVAPVDRAAPVGMPRPAGRRRTEAGGYCNPWQFKLSARRSKKICAHGGAELPFSRAERLTQCGFVLREAALAGRVRAEQHRGETVEGELERRVVLVVSGDGRNVYVASESRVAGGLAVFRRNAREGVLTQLPGTRGCVRAAGVRGRAGARW